MPLRVKTLKNLARHQGSVSRHQGQPAANATRLGHPEQLPTPWKCSQFALGRCCTCRGSYGRAIPAAPAAVWLRCTRKVTAMDWATVVMADDGGGCAAVCRCECGQWVGGLCGVKKPRLCGALGWVSGACQKPVIRRKNPSPSSSPGSTSLPSTTNGSSSASSCAMMVSK